MPDVSVGLEVDVDVDVEVDVDVDGLPDEVCDEVEIVEVVSPELRVLPLRLLLEERRPLPDDDGARWITVAVPAGIPPGSVAASVPGCCAVSVAVTAVVVPMTKLVVVSAPVFVNGTVIVDSPGATTVEVTPPEPSCTT